MTSTWECGCWPRGWRNEYCSAAAVHQQGVVELRRLIRQRSRWFQGHLQSWTLIPLVLREHAAAGPQRSALPPVQPGHLCSSRRFCPPPSCCRWRNCAVLADAGPQSVRLVDRLDLRPDLRAGAGLSASSTGAGNGATACRWSGSSGLAHLYVCYGMIWYASGWWAVVRTLRGRTGWAKTDRVAEAPVVLAQPAAPARAWCPPGFAIADDTPVSPQQPAAQLAEAPTQPAVALAAPASPAGAAAGPDDIPAPGRRHRRAKVLAVAGALACATVGAGLAWSAVAGQGQGTARGSPFSTATAVPT